MIAELGRRIGEVETLARTFPDHEARVDARLGEIESRTSGALEELRTHASGLERLFVEHRHDAPAPVVQHDLVDAMDSPVRAIDEALGDAMPTPEAPHGKPEVEAPVVLKRSRVFRSHIHRGK